MESRHIGALGDVDAYRILGARYKIIALQNPAELAGLYADDGIYRLIKVLFPAEHPGGYRVTLYFLGPAGNGFSDHELQKFPLTLRGVELRAVKNPLKLPSDRSSGRSKTLFGAGFQRTCPPSKKLSCLEMRS